MVSWTASQMLVAHSSPLEQLPEAATQKSPQSSVPEDEPHSNVGVQVVGVQLSGSHVHVLVMHVKPESQVGAVFKVQASPQSSVPSFEPHSWSAKQAVAVQVGGADPHCSWPANPVLTGMPLPCTSIQVMAPLSSWPRTWQCKTQRSPMSAVLKRTTQVPEALMVS